MIGIIAGNFDVIHPGYIRLFKECSENCDTFIVCLQMDPTIERPEKLKPILSVDERLEILEGIKYIDSVWTYNTEKDLYGVLKCIKPDIRFMGDDYKDKPFTGDDLGIKLHWINRDHGWSTTKFKQMIADTL